MAEEKMVNQSRGENLLEIEVYTPSSVESGNVACPSISRVLDLLNNQFFPDAASDKSFLELMGSGVAAGQDTATLYFRKSAIELIALTDANTGRGMGSAPSQKVYPFVPKSSRRVTIELHSYNVVGNIHCAEDQSVLAILNEPKAFFPLTEALITDSSVKSGERPFVAVNRHQIISVREDQQSHTS